MSFCAFPRARLSRAVSFCLQSRFVLSSVLAFILLLCGASVSPAAAIHGVVTDTSGAHVSGATVSLVSGGKVVNSAVTAADGSFQIMTGTEGRFFLIISAKSFRQLETPGFYAGRLDSVERNLVVEPAWVRESIVVTATGVPTPQAQTSEATSVLGPLDLERREDLVTALRLMPGTVMVQEGQLGAQSSLFVRGGNSSANKTLLDGVSVDDMGGQFDFGPLATTAVERAEVYRGANSSLYGADAGSSVVSLTTAHGTTSFPSLIASAEAGNFNSSREEATVAGAHNKLDYLGAYSWLQSGNALPNDAYHAGTAAANLGWQLSANTQIRGTLHYGIDATGVPNAWDFYGIADQATEKDQDLFISGSIDNQTTPPFHNTLRYGAARKREQYNLWRASGIPQAYSNYCYGPATLGNTVTITGANGYSATGQAVLDCVSAHYPSGDQNVNNRDQMVYQGDYRFTPHLTALIGFHWENERGSEPNSTYYLPVNTTNYDYLAGFHGDFKNRFYYTLGGSIEKYSLFGVQGTPHAGLSYSVVRPRKGVLSGTRLLFNFGDAVREPKLTDEDGSLYNFLEANGGQQTIQQLHIGRLAAPTTRTYEGGVEQSFLSERVILRASYFHNEFGREIEYVGLDLVPSLLPNLSAAQQANLENFLQTNFAYELTLNSQAFRAQGVETTIESGIGSHLFLRGGYTSLDAVVQRSFTNDDQALLGPIPTFTNGLPIGPFAPLKGARPFRRPPHTGFFTASYSERKFDAALTAAMASRSDDSTYLEGADVNGLSSLLLPNRNLNHGYAKADLGGSYQLLDWLSVYAQGQNLLGNQHIAPIGYPSLPFTFRMGLRVALGKSGSR